ncbi:hypothetical protein G127AT_11125 [Agromyces archimandritae]|uniref:PH domain-containing protein n=2 Tax=Agromyces archimandritae TaxID=2781962 RepID=A0A975IQ52_9MICO|nr:hypothetical protein G127AT_11125 [Agromyces archimandritae]
MSGTPEELDRWVAALAEELGFDAASTPVGGVLDLARDAAHGVARPAAPLTAYLVGLASQGDPARFEELAGRARALAARWPDAAAPTPAPPSAGAGA